MPKRPTPVDHLESTGTGIWQSNRQKDTTSLLSQMGMKDGFKKDQISSSVCQRKITGFIKRLFYDHLSEVNPLEVNRSGIVMQ